MAKTYLELLKDPRWQKKRLKILERDFFRCCQCGSKEKTLHVHHQYYVKGRNPWEYSDDALLTLCEDCHHGINTHDWVKAFLDLGLTPFDLIHIASMIAYKKQKIFKEYPDTIHDVMKYRFYNVEFDSDEDLSDYSYNFESKYKDKYKNG